MVYLLPTHNTHVVARGDVGVGGLRRVRGGGVGRGGGGGTASGGQHAGDQHLNISYIISYIVLGTESTAAFLARRQIFRTNIFSNIFNI